MDDICDTAFFTWSTYVTGHLEFVATTARFHSTADAAVAQDEAHEKIFVRESLPLTLNGKIDRRKPAPMTMAEPLQWLEGVSLTRQLSALWCQLLIVDSIDPKANVFDLGAHSLTAARAVAELHRHGFDGITITQLYEYPSVAQLAAALGGAHESRSDIDHSERGERQHQALVRFAWQAKAQR
jgi:hypothetical protein